MLKRQQGLTLVETLVAALILGNVVTGFALIARAGGDTSRTAVAANNVTAALQRTTAGIAEGDPRYLTSPVAAASLPTPAVVSLQLTRASPPTYTVTASSDGVTLSALATAPGGPR